MRKNQAEKEEKAVKPPRITKERKPKIKKEREPGNERVFKGTVGDFFRSRIVIGFICIIVSLLIAFVGVPVVQGYVSQRVPVVKVNADLIVQGSQITADMLKIADVAAIDRPANAATSIEQVVGTFAKYDLLLNDTITSGKLTRERPVSHPYLHDLPHDKKAISVSVRGLAEGLSGKLKPGDIVSVYAVFNSANAEDEYSAFQPPELKYVRVLAVSNSYAQDIDLDSEKHMEAQNTAGERENLPATITLLVGDVQAASLAGINHNAIIHVALVARSEDTELCDAFLAEQEVYITSLQDPDAGEDETGTDPSESLEEITNREPVTAVPDDSAPQSPDAPDSSQENGDESEERNDG